ncbi:MAG: HAMP domain-containing histidine kinase [Cyanobacteria bacterium SBLK]|nr:HAMP domain-containing histidine kinase [Cyanobacteria bacterium SBLK]
MNELNELDSHKFGQEILKLLLSSPHPPHLLSEVAEMTGKKWGAVACLLVGDRLAPESDFNGYWHAENYHSLAGEIKRQLFARAIEDATHAPCPLKQVHFIPIPREGAIVLGLDGKKQSLPVEGEEAIANAIALVLTCTRFQQQTRLDEAYQVLLEQFRSNTGQPDLELALATTAKALQVERGAILLLKYSDPLSNHHDSTIVPRARCTVAHQWTATEEILKIHAGRSFWLKDCPCCVTAWQDSPQPFASKFKIHNSRGETSNEANCIDNLASTIPPFFHPDRFPALLLVPLIGTASNSSLVLGFFLFQRDRPYSWHVGEVGLARWAGAQIATTTIYQRTIEQVQSLVNKRTAQLQGSLEVQAKLYEQTRKQVEQLRQLVELKDEFLDSVSHELRTPLTTMKMAISMLRQPGLPPERQDKYLAMLEREWEREYNLIQDLLALQKLETQQIDLQLTKIDLGELVREFQETFNETWQGKGLQLVIRDREGKDADLPAFLYSDRDSLQRILQELLANAGKYSDPESTVYLEIDRLQDQQEGDRVTVAIVNIGEGIAPENIKSIFEKFTRGKEANQQAIAGTGLGLALVKGLVQHLNGKIEVWSRMAGDRQRGETRFTLILPFSMNDKQ